MTTTTTNTPAAWIGSLSAYNEGDLLGDWFDWDEIPSDSEEWVRVMVDRGHLSVPPGSVGEMFVRALAQNHEELWVMDHENFRGFIEGECSPSHAAEVGQKIEDLGEHADAFAAWCSATSEDPLEREWDGDVDELYVGRFENFREYADEWANEQMEALTHGMNLHFLTSHFDYESHARDLEHDFDVLDAPGGGVYIFRNA